MPVMSLKTFLTSFLSTKVAVSCTTLTDEKRQRDLELWQQTKKIDTIKSYQNYLDYCELGEQKEIAAEAIKRLKLEIRLVALEIQSISSEPTIKIIERLSLSKSQDKLVDGHLAPIMVLIPAGNFIMGSAETEKDRFENETQQTIEIEKPFYIGKYPVTFAEYDLFCEQTRLTNKPRENPDDLGWGRENSPVINISWFDAMAYCEWLSQQTGKNYTLPTEVKWEYACRANANTSYCFGDDARQLKDYAWYRKNAAGKTHLVGLKKPNSWGLYDMHGNVWEWTHSEYYENNRAEIPALEKNDHHRPVVKGGSWDYIPWWLRSAYRDGWEANYRNSDLGFRIVKTC